MPRRKNRINLFDRRKGSQRKALSDVISCSTENDVTTERADTLIGLRSSVIKSDNFSNWSNIPSDFQIQLCKFVAVSMCTLLCKFSIINADFHWKVFITDKLVPSNNP